jgi:predicted amidohydrolase
MILKVSLVQPDLVWEKTEENLARLEIMIRKIKTPTDLIILPEMFPTGFSMNTASLAEEMNGPSMKWMKNMAASLSACLTGSIMIKEGPNWFNRLVFMHPSGKFSVYDKRHLFRMGKENEYYKPGEQNVILELNGWKIKPLICYDLRFPVWSRNRMDYDMLIYVASWPESRIEVWEALLKARAIENHSYVIGVSRVGKDGNNSNHTGESMVYDFRGRQILKLPANIETTGTVSLNKEALTKFRSAFPVWKDADEFTLSD